MEAILFYDGTCGLCHGAVRFVLRFDRRAHFYFAPLQGETFTQLIDARTAATLPDSLVLRTQDACLRTRSAAVLGIAAALEPPWNALGRALGLIPETWLDRLYDCIARLRQRFFRRPASLCPIVPAELRSRFLP